MSKIAEYKRLEAQLAEQLAALDKLKTDGQLKREMEFEDKLRALIDEYGFDTRTVLDILDPASAGEVAPVSRRRARETKIYTNPHTGEVVKTKGGNHKVLSAWKKQYGADAVKSWVA
ncbi:MULTISPECIES: histone-like nucleoid-structuring protein, MvaT/MvaU family [Stutzerimonas stutzeri subgroup]|uniref:histone-like nucleoid-structuring protein, MvaT/MvaU family n=1 Tax=Stutzerimonas stutzeri subgroup TaxID=578833 RepID=UPI002897525F|nr:MULTISPECIES: histone-like nucleoid-structuring protein, MvaT/MvaU family [Stutzerimonas stutzeri subgroup]